jgi:hypothetical protein
VCSVIGLAYLMSAAFAGRARRDRSAFVIAISLAVLALAACGAATEPQGPPAVKTSGDIVALMDTPRLTSLTSNGEVVTAEGQASRSEGDYLRTYWFTSVGAIAHVQHLGGSLIVRKVLHGTTLLDAGDTGEEPVGTLTDPATFLTEEDLNAHALQFAETAGVVVEEVNYVPFFGGTAEFVLHPRDELEFMSELDLSMYEFFRDLPQEPRPFLLTFVDSSGANRRVWGGFSLSDPDQGWQRAHLSDGTKVVIAEWDGFAWQADDLTKALGVDASGRPVEGLQPVEGAPGP